MIYKPSASSLDRAFKCTASAIIPLRVSSENEKAVRGTWLHKYVELIVEENLLPEAALFRIPEEYRDVCRRTDLTFLEGLEGAQCEVSFVVDFVTGEARYLGKGLGRNYPDVADTEFTGTIDIYARKGDKTILIDMKSGMQTTPCEMNLQMKFGAYAIHKVYGHETVDASLLYLREADENIEDSYRFEDFESIRLEFLDFVNRLAKDEWKYMNGGQLNMFESSACEYCPAAIGCPAKVNAIRALAGKIGDEDNFDKLNVSIGKLTNDQLAVAWVNYMKIKNYFDVAEKSLRAKIREVGGIQTETFKVTPTECERSSLDANKVVKLAKRLGATPEDLDKCQSKTYFTRLRETPVKPGAKSVTDKTMVNKE